ncbi:DUF7689 domain-containing protein [Planktothricoides raciborskii]|uniref:DUF7689 domain-containing protein n=1 Tax=Planktothricoides raciborskii FACHB-1370 TaxID=2949576 RepID=A0ABR8EMZ0_9CYAN|nr:hypothetical protein [Planktothricoides raciborskii]MBD2547318.1 hypothetical protein [Planktothricoides raciborskii FACHB-1370]MBD2585210.1 hypothetical protein [Planktothricoides raciborskii FACHB-1261]
MATDGRLEPYQEEDFPNLAATGYCITSKRSRLYNCFAWAAGEDDRWWNPLESNNSYYWPDGVPAEMAIAAFIQAYQTLGYEPCENADLESGFEKIAIYATPDGEPTHAARQLPNGKWTSKLGRWEDIEHELDGLTSEIYGSVKQILKRPLG